jgi:hypothetical protein
MLVLVLLLIQHFNCRLCCHTPLPFVVVFVHAQVHLLFFLCEKWEARESGQTAG